jgi:hypothetical protein
MNRIARYRTNGKKKPAISNGFCTSLDCAGLCLGGDEGDRTPGLGVANAALSQLSYIPVYFDESGVLINFLTRYRARAYMICREAVKE